jgi:hypothetical protein
MTPHLAPSLVELRAEINARWPKRSKASDGWLGDAAHAARKSEHNPDSRGVVHAIDITTAGIEKKTVLRDLIGDSRVWYVIHDGVIWSRTHDWKALHYNGENPHHAHIHVSILLTRAAETKVSTWLAKVAKPKPVATLRVGSTGERVKTLQRFLGIAADGVFGPKTKAAVAKYQRMRGQRATGVVTAATWAPIVAALKS